MNAQEQQDMQVANCVACTIANAMKDCPNCLFNVGLEARCRFIVEHKQPSEYDLLGVSRKLILDRVGGGIYHNVLAEHDAMTRKKILNALDAGLPLPDDIPFSNRPLAESTWRHYVGIDPAAQG